MGWIMRINLAPTLAETTSALLWDLNTTGIADLGNDDETGRCELIAGFDTRHDADAAAETLLNNDTGDNDTGDNDTGDNDTGGLLIEVASIEPVDRSVWVDEAETSRLDLGGTTTEFAVGGAFGHGGHPTTRLALELMQLELRQGSAMLDFGAGTGVLTLAAVALGATRLLAVENDHEALAVAKSNLAPIKPPASVDLVERLPTGGDHGRFDVVVANVLLGVHVSNATGLVDVLSDEGALIVSGVLAEQCAAILAAYEGLVVDERRQHQDWLALTLRKGSEAGGS